MRWSSRRASTPHPGLPHQVALPARPATARPCCPPLLPAPAQVLIDSRYKNVYGGRATTDEEITGLLIAILFAGQHTSSVTSSWTGYRMLGSRQWWEAAQQEQRDVMAQHGDKLDVEVLQSMDVLHRNIQARAGAGWWGRGVLIGCGCMLRARGAAEQGAAGCCAAFRLQTWAAPAHLLVCCRPLAGAGGAAHEPAAADGDALRQGALLGHHL